MKVVILCGGKGLRMGDLDIPKPLIQIGNRPVLWHIMKHYSYYGFNEFILCLGHNGERIREYFYHYAHNQADMEINTKTGQITYMRQDRDDFRIIMAKTGEDTLTGGRIKAIEKYIDTDNFFVTYGDGVSNINIKSLLETHLIHKKIATVSGIVAKSQFGVMQSDYNNMVMNFSEKKKENDYINGGFFVFNKKVFYYLDEHTMLEEKPMTKLVQDKELMIYKHNGFWSCMDTKKDKERLNDMWKNDDAMWKVWEGSIDLVG